MRIAIVDDLKTERALLKERLSQQLALRGVEADILGFESGEAFLAAEKERRFSAAFLHYLSARQFGTQRSSFLPSLTFSACQYTNAHTLFKLFGTKAPFPARNLALLVCRGRTSVI